MKISQPELVAAILQEIARQVPGAKVSQQDFGHIAKVALEICGELEKPDRPTEAKPTEAEPLAFSCESCGSEPGEPCWPNEPFTELDGITVCNVRLNKARLAAGKVNNE